MDPQAAYDALCKFFSFIEEPGDWSYDEARERWHALDEWMTDGGFGPREWSSEATPIFGGGAGAHQ